MKKGIRHFVIFIGISAFLSGCGGQTETTSNNNAATPSENNPASSSTSAVLTWAAPATRTDSSPLSLSEIHGYKIYSGTTANDLSLLANLTDPSATSYTDNNLSSGTHYYAVTVYDVDGVESDYSPVVSKTID